jgi:hypothetical protein
LMASEEKLFCAGALEFAKEDKVKDDGLGPTMNLTSCFGCHQYPLSGGTSPLGKNPQYDFGNSYPSGTNEVPPFVLPSGPVRVARFKQHLDVPGHPDDGGVHSLFTITGLEGADGCVLAQEDFQKEIDRKNIIYRIPTPTFGAGLIEQIDDKTIVDNVNYQAGRVFGGNTTVRISRGRLNLVQPFHTNGSENRNGNDGTIARFGWKAQNKSLLIFAGEAYNVEIGISNEVFPTEREEKRECQFHTVPNDTSHPENLFDPDPKVRLDALSDVEKFAAFMRFLAPPEPSTDTPGGAVSIALGADTFDKIGCSACHTARATYISYQHSGGAPEQTGEIVFRLGTSQNDHTRECVLGRPILLLCRRCELYDCRRHRRHCVVAIIVEYVGNKVAHNLQPVFSRKDAGDEDAIAPNLDHRIAARDGVLTKLKLDHAVSSAGRRREFPKWPIRVPKGGLRTDSDQADAEAGGPGI